MGATLLGFTSVLPTKVTPSSITSLDARTSPKTSALDLISILSLALTYAPFFSKASTPSVSPKEAIKINGVLRSLSRVFGSAPCPSSFWTCALSPALAARSSPRLSS